MPKRTRIINCNADDYEGDIILEEDRLEDEELSSLIARKMDSNLQLLTEQGIKDEYDKIVKESGEGLNKKDKKKIKKRLKRKQKKILRMLNNNEGSDGEADNEVDAEAEGENSGD